MAAKPSELEDEIARLYVLPLAEFIPARNALAVRLRKEGDRDASERVKGLAKPPASAWAVNVLFRDETEKMDALLAAGATARRALGEALGQGAGESLRKAIQEERELRDSLRRKAEALLAKEGGAPGKAIVDRIGVNLEALALNPAAAEVAKRRWLDQDLEQPGFEVLAGLQTSAHSDRRGLRLVPAAEEEKGPEKEKEKKPKGEDPAERAERERREREEAKRRERIAAAEEKVAHLAEEADSLAREAGKAEKSAAEAERAAAEARRRAEFARQSADRAAERVARAKADLAALE